jgi:hypothetical protein
VSDLASTDGKALRGIKLGGIAAKHDDSVTSTHDPNTIYSTISEGFWEILFQDIRDITVVEPHPGSVVGLVGHTAIPCVCEVPPTCAPLFSAAGAKVVSEGVTWQSLYLVILGRHLLLAEPERGG